MLLIRVRNLCLVLASRGLFVGHSLLTIWKCVTYLNVTYYWMFLCVDVFIIFEALVVIMGNKNIGFRWLCTSAALYIVGTAPALWMLELQRLYDQKQSYVRQEKLAEARKTNQLNDTIERFAPSVKDDVNQTKWTQALEQLFLLILILGRWIMPKGNMSRIALSQLLFVYLAISSDVMGLFVLFFEVKIVMSTPMHYVILTAWTLSLFQMTITTPPPKKPMQHFVIDSDNLDELVPGPVKVERVSLYAHPEIISLASTFLLMDAPFLIIRLYVVLGIKLLNYNVIFFIFKNFIMVLLTIYRVYVVFKLIRTEEEETQKKAADHAKTIGIRTSLIRFPNKFDTDGTSNKIE